MTLFIDIETADMVELVWSESHWEEICLKTVQKANETKWNRVSNSEAKII